MNYDDNGDVIIAKYVFFFLAKTAKFISCGGSRRSFKKESIIKKTTIYCYFF